jgi:hypothetical protein
LLFSDRSDRKVIMVLRTRASAAAAVAALAAALAIGGCTGPPPPTSVPPPADDIPSEAATDPGAVTWMDGVCTALLPVGSLGEKISATDGADDASLTRVLTVIGDTLGQAVTGLNGIGPSPVAGGDAAVGTVKDALGRAAASVGDAKTKVAAGDPAAIGPALDSISGSLDALGPLTEAQDNPELRKAAADAPTCRKLAGATPG